MKRSTGFFYLQGYLNIAHVAGRRSPNGLLLPMELATHPTWLYLAHGVGQCWIAYRTFGLDNSYGEYWDEMFAVNNLTIADCEQAILPESFR
ncbi:MAG: hypothetical protein ACR2JC_06220 [Chloroflexota bacterium]